LTWSGYSSSGILLSATNVTPPDREFSTESIEVIKNVNLTENSGARDGELEKGEIWVLWSFFFEFSGLISGVFRKVNVFFGLN